jgi:hypothetical protein
MSTTTSQPQHVCPRCAALTAVLAKSRLTARFVTDVPSGHIAVDTADATSPKGAAR